MRRSPATMIGCVLCLLWDAGFLSPAEAQEWTEPVRSTEEVPHTLGLDLRLGLGYGTIPVFDFMLDIPLRLFMGWEVALRAEGHEVGTKFQRLFGDERHWERKYRFLPEGELFLAIPVLRYREIARRSGVVGGDGRGRVIAGSASVPVRVVWALVTGGKLAYTTGNRTDWAVPFGMRYGVFTSAKVVTTVRSATLTDAWWLQGRALFLPGDRKAGFDAEVRWGLLYGSVTYFPASDATAGPSPACDVGLCDYTEYPYSSFHGKPGSSQILGSGGIRLAGDWDISGTTPASKTPVESSTPSLW